MKYPNDVIKKRYRPDLELIKSLVCEEFNISRSRLTGPSRSKAIVTARLVGYWLSFKYTEHSSVTIGCAFKKDSTTILSGIRNAEVMIEDDYKTSMRALKIAEIFSGEKQDRRLHFGFFGFKTDPFADEILSRTDYAQEFFA